METDGGDACTSAPASDSRANTELNLMRRMLQTNNSFIFTLQFQSCWSSNLKALQTLHCMADHVDNKWELRGKKGSWDTITPVDGCSPMQHPVLFPAWLPLIKQRSLSRFLPAGEELSSKNNLSKTTQIPSLQTKKRLFGWRVWTLYVGQVFSMILIKACTALHLINIEKAGNLSNITHFHTSFPAWASVNIIWQRCERT